LSGCIGDRFDVRQGAHSGAHYIGSMPTLTNAPQADSVAEPLAGFSHCHLGITRQLAAFAELPTLHAAAGRAREVAAAR